MSLGDWVRNTTERIRETGAAGVVESGYVLYRGSWRVGCSRLPIGTNVYDRNWDALVILDGCRVDAMEASLDGREWDATQQSIRSVGSSSREWLAKTFHPDNRDAVADTVYVTANPYSDEMLTPGGAPGNPSPFNPKNWPCLNKTDFAHVEEVWRDGWDGDLGTVPPRRVTDRGIDLARSRDPEKLIIHYMQPHQPFIPIRQQLSSTDPDDPEHPRWVAENCWGVLHDGDVSKSAVWKAYLDNLALVLEDVELFLRSIDAERTVVTADHGNAFGEWGIYGHPAGFLHPSVRRVPWVETRASDDGAYEPPRRPADAYAASVEERLEQLGYL